jgi:hypothetical protein
MRSGEQSTDRTSWAGWPGGTVIEPDVQDENLEVDGTEPGEAQPEPSTPNITSLAPRRPSAARSTPKAIPRS